MVSTGVMRDHTELELSSVPGKSMSIIVFAAVNFPQLQLKSDFTAHISSEFFIPIMVMWYSKESDLFAECD